MVRQYKKSFLTGAATNTATDAATCASMFDRIDLLGRGRAPRGASVSQWRTTGRCCDGGWRWRQASGSAVRVWWAGDKAWPLRAGGSTLCMACTKWRRLPHAARRTRAMGYLDGLSTSLNSKEHAPLARARARARAALLAARSRARKTFSETVLSDNFSTKRRVACPRTVYCGPFRPHRVRARQQGE